jgi:hypothetical protein
MRCQPSSWSITVAEAFLTHAISSALEPPHTIYRPLQYMLLETLEILNLFMRRGHILQYII